MKTMNQNKINLEGYSNETPVYRVFSIERLVQLFEQKQNALVKPSKWDDPFENFFLQQQAKDIKENRIIDLSTIQNALYGQCWTLNGEDSDALWRIYAPNKYGARVKTTLGKLFSSFCISELQHPDISCYIGKVSYLSKEEIYERFNNSYINDFMDSKSKGFCRTLLVKRNAFKHENELRLIYHITEKSNSNSVLKYNIRPNDLVDEILLDPRIDDSYYNHLKSAFEKLYEYDGSIQKSTLYRSPELELFFDPDRGF